MMNSTTKLTSSVALVAALALSGCGGGGNDNGNYFPIVTGPTTPTDPGSGSGNTTDGFIAYVKSLVSMSSETAEPANVAAYDPAPRDDTSEPVAVP